MTDTMPNASEAKTLPLAEQAEQGTSEPVSEAQELEKMRNTLASFLMVIKQLDDRVKRLERSSARNLEKAERLTALERLQKSNNANRTIKAEPIAIALTAHLLSRGATMSMIIDSELLSYSKAFAVSKWDKQHLHDYCTVNYVADVLHDGLPISEAKKIMTVTDVLKPLFKK